MFAFTDLHIRSVHQDDFAVWKSFRDGYNAFYGRVGETGLPDIVTQTAWQRLLDETKPVHALVTERGDELLGTAHFLHYHSTAQIDMSYYLQDLSTVQATRGQGVGRALIEAVYHRAQVDSLPRVYWQTHETNATATRLYDILADKPGLVVYCKLF